MSEGELEVGEELIRKIERVLSDNLIHIHNECEHIIGLGKY